MIVTGPLSTRLLAWCFFRLYGRDGATVGMVASDLRRVGLVEGSLPYVRRGVRSIVDQWVKIPRGRHRAMEPLSSVRYRATLSGH